MVTIQKKKIARQLFKKKSHGNYLKKKIAWQLFEKKSHGNLKKNRATTI